MRLERGEEVLRGKKVTDELIAQVGVIAGEDAEPESDLRGSEAYKRSIREYNYKTNVEQGFRKSKTIEIAMGKHNVTMTINGESVSAEVDSRLLLVHFIRENLDMTGTHIGCDTSKLWRLYHFN